MPKKNQPTDAQTFEGRFLQLIFSPKGAVEGLLLELDGAPAQFTCDAHDAEASAGSADLREGQAVAVEAVDAEPSPKGEPAHPVRRLVRLVSVDGAPVGGRETVRASGTVARFNYAKHGAANGVVLDNGDFIHTRPDGMERLGLKIGDRLEAEGDARPLATGGGRAVEARTVNGRPIGAGHG